MAAEGGGEGVQQVHDELGEIRDELERAEAGCDPIGVDGITLKSNQ